MKFPKIRHSLKRDFRAFAESGDWTLAQYPAAHLETQAHAVENWRQSP